MKTSTFALRALFPVRVASVAALGRPLLGLALAGLALLTVSPSPTAARTLDDGAMLPRGDWRVLADFRDGSTLSRNFVERGAAQFVTTSGGLLQWEPSATNIYSIVYAQRGQPVPVRDPAVAVEFQLAGEGASLGLHLHGSAEAEPSHLILVSRSAADRGLIRAYRTPIWPSSSIPASHQINSPLARLTHFPADEWYKLTVTTRSDEISGHTVLSVRLTTADETLVGSMDAVDTGKPLPAGGLVALRIFGGAGARHQVRALLGQPQP